MKKALSTRLSILQKSFELIYTQGYQATSIDTIIATTNVTKGAFFYHFKNKDEMGLAVINEIMYPLMQEDFVKPLLNSKDAVSDIYKMMQYLLLENSFLLRKYGCPAGNLTQEMPQINQQFGEALFKLSAEVKEAMQIALKKGKDSGAIKPEVNEEQVTLFVLSGYWGIRNLGKLFDSNDCYVVYLKELKRYLKSLEKN
ncbi:TetR/AcrR family transcriptional regulator [Flavobacterium sp. FlaQc-52]|jgi:TetR/AcrR family transcriptional repressor of nem operon|uniref:TetR/AcrR family transcriptional regulator n=1 Tax=Flavobacterium sp. FlaQc-52 TaxID=3374185 RepID=UPI003757BD86